MGPHERALRKDVRRLPPEDRGGALVRLGLTLAQTLDAAIGPDRIVFMPPRDLQAISGELQKVLASLSRLQEPAAVSDPIDELAAKRVKRRTG